jgi:DNA mismatch repair protein MutH
MQTIEEIHTKLLPLVGIDYNMPITKNKGAVGIKLEELLGIEHTQNCLDCSDGELKTFPLKKLKNGKLVPKETIAITMMCLEELRKNDFKSSKCSKKLDRILVVPYFRDGDTIRFMAPKIINRCPEFVELYNTIESDYETIRENYIKNGILQSKTGTLLQNRTKGAGHGSTSRAFYLRKEFMNKFIL